MKARSWKKLLPKETSTDSTSSRLAELKELAQAGSWEEVAGMVGGAEGQRIRDLLEERRQLEAQIKGGREELLTDRAGGRQGIVGDIPSVVERKKQISAWEDRRRKAMDRLKELKRMEARWEAGREKWKRTKEQKDTWQRSRDQKKDRIRQEIARFSDSRAQQEDLAKRLDHTTVRESWDTLREKKRQALSTKRKFEQKASEKFKLDRLMSFEQKVEEKREEVKERALSALKEKKKQAREEEERREQKRLRKKKK